ncbi:MAG: pyridoxamine 5'-phosphate oxidase family protein [Rhodospirillales bacterium]|nr:pyridoxamine 5'-phosphate oxidase family protein [Rhodospirillales bacterium]
MALIPEILHEYISTAYPKNLCLVSIMMDDGYPQVSPRGSVIVYDGDTLAYWDRGKGHTFETVEDGTKVTVFFRNPELGARGGNGTLPAGGVARFYGIAEVHAEDGEVRERVWNEMVEPERTSDPEKKGRAVLVKLERAEQLSHKPLSEIEGA